MKPMVSSIKEKEELAGRQSKMALLALLCFFSILAFVAVFDQGLTLPNALGATGFALAMLLLYVLVECRMRS